MFKVYYVDKMKYMGYYGYGKELNHMINEKIENGLSEKDMQEAIEESIELAKKLAKLDKSTRKKLDILLDGIEIGRKSLEKE